MNEDASDEQLVARAQAGDPRAFDLLIRKYQHKVIKLTARYVNPADAPDVAQEAFIKAYRALDGFKGDSAFYTWLYRISINTAKNYLVSRGRRPPGSDLDISDAEIVDHVIGDQRSDDRNEHDDEPVAGRDVFTKLQLVGENRDEKSAHDERCDDEAEADVEDEKVGGCLADRRRHDLDDPEGERDLGDLAEEGFGQGHRVDGDEGAVAALALTAVGDVASLVAVSRGTAFPLSLLVPPGDDVAGTMSVMTSVGQILLVTGGLLCVARLSGWADVATGLAGVIGLQGLVGHLYGSDDLYVVGLFGTMSLPTSLAITALGGGLVVTVLSTIHHFQPVGLQ